MYIEAHTITCPACRGHRYIGHLICLECCGDGRIVFNQRPAHWSGKALLYYFLGVCVALGGLYLVLRKLGLL